MTIWVLTPVKLGEEHAPKIDKKHVKAIAAIVGEKNVSQSDYDRLAVSYGQTMYDLLRMRHRRFDSLPDLVVFSGDKRADRENRSLRHKE